MALSISIFQPQKVSVKFHHKKHSFLSCPSSISVPKPSTSLPIFPICQSTRSQTGPVKKGSSSSSSASANQKKRKKRSKTGGSDNLRDVEIVKGEVDNDNDEDSYTYSNSSSNSRSLSYLPNTPLPKPPAGFVVDESGRVLMASDKRIVTILGLQNYTSEVDSSNNHPLECIIRRVFRSSQGDECMLLCPVDTPVQILKSKNIDGWSAVSDEEVEAILPAAAYALAKIHMHLVHSGFCYTARGGFCYSEDDIFDFRTDDGQDVDGLPTEGVEIACFHLDQDGQLQIADDDLLEDPAIISAIDEETEFNALVEEEAALLESLMGER
ncbi:uncharacterized protein LOC110628189 isoform X3 [Manihot esculenta]|uniref:uncharacterized protein LOC110628189 isoform X3 n=1 Tax=Manihot esculenta TaxID=3983 RepID=UPI000B5D3EC3|nr:uncharacterized protein LOC110628189 isoform X3 [Manihot esculenta]XP_021630415.1 uncharacterized protein LOC110628189 isoform X3 [Manihot esculenta]